jgi:predicted Rossmann fold flavoprotein
MSAGKITSTDVLIIGAGAAGLMCALTAAKRGRAVILLDHARKLAEKIRISGGGRCNFTNLHVRPDNYLSLNPHFCRSALARYTPQHFMALLEKHGIGFHEKTLGQLFCDEGAQAIIDMLKSECDDAGVRWHMPCEIEAVEQTDGFRIQTSRGTFQTASLVIATGGLSIPKIGATPFGYRLAEQFDIPLTRLKPGLVPLNFHPQEWMAYSDLAGVSLETVVSCGKQRFRENLLFTHRGLSGPAILQISSYWEHGQPLSIDLLPDHDLHAIFTEQRASKMLLANFLAQYLPKRLAETIAMNWSTNLPINQHPARQLTALADRIKDWRITPTGTQGYAKAEVTCGGVDTQALSSKTMECTQLAGLYFIGELVDVTGQLGGYNFQWAWASGHAAGLAA